MKQYQYILLDWDGNLAKTLDVWLDSIRRALESRSFHLSDDAIGATFGQLMPSFIALGVTDPESAIDEIKTSAIKQLPEVDLYPDALELLEYLRDTQKQTALVTTSGRAAIDPPLAKYHLHDLFTSIVTGDDVTHHKPHPEPLEKALAALSGTKAQAIMIGDTEKDIICANNFGIDSILFMPPEHSKYYDFEAMLGHKPTFVVSDLRQVMDIIH